MLLNVTTERNDASLRVPEKIENHPSCPFDATGSFLQAR